MAHKATEIARVIVSLTNPEIGDTISNLKVQKLLYYTQGFHLAIYNKPLFDEEIVAWQYGPVVPDVYREYKQYGSSSIPVEENVDISFLSDDEFSLIKEVYEVYGQFSAFKLMELTHSEAPWQNTGINDIITHDKLKEHFSALTEN